jgi:hypothetical protein
VLAWALALTALELLKKFSPFNIPDRGHRVFGIKTEKARDALIAILRKGGLKPKLSFRSAPTKQTLFDDNVTVINYLDPEPLGLPATAMSLVVSDPEASARLAKKILFDYGYKSEIISDIIPTLPPNHFVILRCSEVFDGWVLAFRLPLFKMPKPQK